MLAWASSDMEVRLSSIWANGHRTGVAGEIVGAGKNHHDFGLQRDHVRAKADQHLRRGLSADAAVDVRLAGEESAELGLHPHVGDGIAHEDDALLVLSGRLHGGVGVVIAGDVGPVLESLLVVGEFCGDRGEFFAIGVRFFGIGLRGRLGVDDASVKCCDHCTHEESARIIFIRGSLRVGRVPKWGPGKEVARPGHGLQDGRNGKSRKVKRFAQRTQRRHRDHGDMANEIQPRLRAILL